MSFIIPIVFILLILFAATALAKNSKSKNNNRNDPIIAKNPLSEHEQAMYFRLVESLPDYIVLSQVAFSALIKAKLFKTRNTFDRKYADFVICKKSFYVVAVIELDDASHKGKEKEDQAREKLLTEAGYKVLRFKRIPNIDQVKKLFNLDTQE